MFIFLLSFLGCQTPGDMTKNTGTDAIGFVQLVEGDTFHVFEGDSVYLLSGGKKCQFISWQAYLDHGYTYSMAKTISDSQFDSIPTGDMIQEILAPQIFTVTNVGMRLVNLGFSRKLDKASAETIQNYIVKNNKNNNGVVQIISAKLLSDGKTVQLFLEAGMYNDFIEDSIEVCNVQNFAQTATMTTITKNFVMSDSSIPVVSSAIESLGTKSIRLNVSEALQDVSIHSFKIDDKILNSASGVDTSMNLYGVSINYPDAGDYTKILFVFENGLSLGVHTLSCNVDMSMKDYNAKLDGTSNPNYMQPVIPNFAISADVEIPVLSVVEALSQNMARYTFSKGMLVPDSYSFFWSTATNQTSGTPATSVMKVSDSVYDVIWSSTIPTGQIYFYCGTSTYPVKDYSGNSISPLPSSKLVNVVRDIAPNLLSVSTDTDSDKIINLYFDKEVTLNFPTNKYIFKDINGKLLNQDSSLNFNNNFPIVNGLIADQNTTSVKVISDNQKKIVIKLGDANQYGNALPGGVYQLTVEGIEGKSGVAMAAQTFTFTVFDKTRPYLYNGFFNSDSVYYSGNSITLKYSEHMDNNACFPDRYKVKNVTGYSEWTKISDIPGISLSFSNNNKDITITFPSSILINSSTELMIGYIEGSNTFSPKDVAGNIFQNLTDSSVTVNGIVSAKN